VPAESTLSADITLHRITAADSAPLLVNGSVEKGEYASLATRGEGGPSSADVSAHRWISVDSVVSWFDAWTNMLDFFTVKRRSPSGGGLGTVTIDTEFFEGVRTIAMLFVMYGHTLYFAMLFGYADATKVPDFVMKYDSVGVSHSSLWTRSSFYRHFWCFTCT